MSAAALRLWPGNTQTEAEQQRTGNPLLLASQKIASQYADRKASDVDKQRAMVDLTTVEFYRRYMERDRRKELDPKTVKLDWDALTWFGQVGVPEEWPEFVPWEGPALGYLTTAWLDTLVEESLLQGLSHNTLGKYLRHLRTIWNDAAKLGLIPKLSVTIPKEQPQARPYTDAEVEKIYNCLAECPAMQVAFVLALAIGPRFGDLFWLEWSQIDFNKRQLTFTAEKTRKVQLVPLTDIPILHLQRLPRDQAPFASLVDQTIPPDFRAEHYQARTLNARWRSLTGFTSPPRLKKHRPPNCVPHPWHSARSTAGVWIERVSAGMASVLLGHDLDGDQGKKSNGKKVTRDHYLIPEVPEDLRAAAEKVMWPEYFSSIREPRQKLLF
jgi:integrase